MIFPFNVLWLAKPPLKDTFLKYIYPSKSLNAGPILGVLVAVSDDSKSPL